MTALVIGAALFLLGGVTAIGAGSKRAGFVFASGAVLAQFFILPATLQVLLTGSPAALAVNFSFPLGTAYLRLDPLAAFFATLISFGGLLTAVYSLGYMKMYAGSRYSLAAYYFFMGLLIAAMLLVVICQNALLFLICWEIMSLASFFLVSFEHEKEEVRRAGLYYLIAMQVSAAFLLAAIVWTAVLAGSLDFAAFGKVLGQPGAQSIGLFLLFFLGFGTKAGLLPLHTWLPLAHPAAPTGVSAIMSGVMIKTGIYGLLRLLLIGGVPNVLVAYVVFGISLISGIYGVMNAIVQHDLKKLLAYHSIENIGIIGTGVGLGMLGLAYGANAIALCGFLGAILHVFNHFTFKSLLFYGAGVIYTKTHTREIEKLGGLVHALPATTALFLIGSLAISGLPLFSGFISEFAIYTGLVRGLSRGSVILRVALACGLVGLAFIGVQAVLCFTKAFSVCFLGLPRTPRDEPISEAPASMLAPMFTLGIIILGIGLVPLLSLPLLKNVIFQFLPAGTATDWDGLAELFSRLGLAIAMLGGLIVFFLALRWLLLKGKPVTIFKTWDCGYQVASSRMSYTASSFAAPFLQLMAPFIPQVVKVRSPRGFFPRKARYESHAEDFVAFYLLGPLRRFLDWFMGLFTWMQSGQTQQYILYGLTFLFILIIWIIFTP